MDEQDLQLDAFVKTQDPLGNVREWEFRPVPGNAKKDIKSGGRETHTKLHAFEILVIGIVMTFIDIEFYRRNQGIRI